MGNLDKDTMAKAYRGFRTKIEAVVEVNGNFFNPGKNGPLGAPMLNGLKKECPCSTSSPADPKILSWGH